MKVQDARAVLKERISRTVVGAEEALFKIPVLRSSAFKLINTQNPAVRMLLCIVVP
jgi:hypothetical protein